jgi:hypothetical protein
MDACLALTIGSRERVVRIEMAGYFFLDFVFSLFLSAIEDILITISSHNKKVDRIATQFDSIRNLINLPAV